MECLGRSLIRPIELFARLLSLRCRARIIGRTSCQDGFEAESSPRAADASAGHGGGGRRRAGQGEMPFAVVEGEPVTELPRDLYIPPYALEVFLEAFEGPLDLLLYLIRRQNLDILDIPIAEISRQYVQYIELMKEIQFELAGEYLVMAATLAEIKSRMLLPRSGDGDEDEEDPRAELVRRLQEYERFKKAAHDIDALERMERDVLQASADVIERTVVTKLPDITLKELLLVFKERSQRSEMFAHHHVQPRAAVGAPAHVERARDAASRALRRFHPLVRPDGRRIGVTVTFLAVLELAEGAPDRASCRPRRSGRSTSRAAQARPRRATGARKNHAKIARRSGSGRTVMDETEIKHVVEAALLAAGRPLTLERLAELFTGKGPGVDRATLKRVARSARGGLRRPRHRARRSLERLSHPGAARDERLARRRSGKRRRRATRVRCSRRSRWSRIASRSRAPRSRKSAASWSARTSCARCSSATGSVSSAIATCRANRRCSARRASSSTTSA